ncbi:uncharacterized protein LOC114530181 [Dendronephthya gigantea]|uniref:uncharacterized protein LOC114530181 n=1 Tax=Dendronephthya gigantea TaxID=151771 RepID=UPI00106DC428|nr:uncharacterized protein LOC114530181 [Dendronephthya gigantea]
MATNILPAKFEGDDIVAWLREFDACALANGWKDEDKIKKLPAFLRGRAATHFYTIPDEERSTYAAATKKLKEALCPPVERENNYVKFEARMLRVGEDPSIYKWELEQLLEKADPTLGDEAKSALLSRQFMRGLPNTIREKLLAHNPTPTLTEMLSFVQRYRAIEEHKPGSTSASTAAENTNANIDRLVGLVTELATRQKTLEDQLATSQQMYTAAIKQQDRNRPRVTCFRCGKQGHLARDCRSPSQRQDRSNVRCYECHRYGHFARECGNYAPLNYQGASRGHTGQ